MADLNAIVDATARAERGRIVGGLLRWCGDLDAAEEAFQEALLSALEAWRTAVPDNPGAWLMTTAKHHVADAHRRRAVSAEKAPLLVEDARVDGPVDVVTDDHLRLLLACCHPALGRDNQIALTLKVVAGFSTEEIARAFVCSEATVSQRILRAKQALAEPEVAFELPTAEDLPARLEGVLGVVHAMFNEGHTARTGPWMRLDLQAEALRLGRLLCDLAPNEPDPFALVALMTFTAARARTRVDAEGVPILLPAQDRSRWDRELLREGLVALGRAQALGGRGPTVLEAAIAAVHVTAPTWESTDFHALVALYDALVARVPSPIVRLNRAVAVGLRDGPAAGLAALEGLEAALGEHHLFYATRAELRAQAGEDGRADLLRAVELVTNEAERVLLGRRLARLR